MLRRLVVLAGGILLLSTSWTSAQDTVLSQMYGAGVHAFHSNDYARAYEQFSAAIQGGSRDPRCHYYRGLCLARLGRSEEAQSEFQLGATLETEDINKFYNVPAALQRVQGADRVLLEQYRTKARLVALQRERERRAARYGELRQEEQRVLQQQAESAPATLPAPITQLDAPADVFQTGPIEEAKPEAAPAESEQTEEATDAASSDMFSEEPATEEEADTEMKAEEEPAEEIDDPFDAGSAKVGSTAKKAPKKDVKPAPAADEAADDDTSPFGDMPTEDTEEPAEEPAEMPAEKEEPAADESPFGNMPAEKPLGDEEEEKADEKDEPAVEEEEPAMAEEEPAAKEDEAAAADDEKDAAMSEEEPAAEMDEPAEEEPAAGDESNEEKADDETAPDPFK